MGLLRSVWGVALATVLVSGCTTGAPGAPPGGRSVDATPFEPAAPPQPTPAAPSIGAPATTAPAMAAPAEPPLVGGYTRGDVKDPAIGAAAAEAIRLLQARAKDPTLSLVTIRAADTQVVAGVNYRLELDVRSASGPRNVKAVVYKDLAGKYELTSVEGL